MKSVLDKYGRYLLRMTTSEVLGELQRLQIELPSQRDKQSCIQVILRGDRNAIGRRLAELEPKEQQGGVVGRERLRKILGAGQRKMEKKLGDAKNSIMAKYANAYQLSLKGTDTKVEAKVENSRSSVFDLEELQLSKPHSLNWLLNAQQQVRLHPDRIHFEYQRGIGELLDSFVTYRSEEYLLAKEKELFQRMLPKEVEPRGNSIHNILMLYGVRKEEYLEDRLKDPLESLLVETRMSEKARNKALQTFLSRIPDRRRYFTAVIGSLSLQQLQELVSKLQHIREMNLLTEMQKIEALLIIAKMIRNNHKCFGKEYYKVLLKLQGEGDKPMSFRVEAGEKMMLIEGWLVDTLEWCRKWIEGYSVRREEQAAVMRQIIAYKRLKELIQREWSQQIGQKQKSLFLNRVCQQIDRKSMVNTLSASESQQFNEKVLEMVVFFESKVAEHTWGDRISLYRLILEYMVELQELQVESEVFQKVVRDSIVLLQRPAKPELVDRKYIHSLITLVFKFNVYAPRNELAAMFKLLWKWYQQLHASSRQMHDEEGKYFIMLTHICTQLGQQQQEVKRETINSESYLLFLRKYMQVLVRDKKDSADKKVIVAMLRDDVLSLLPHQQ